MAERSDSGLVVVCLLSVLAVTSVHGDYEHWCTLENRSEVNEGLCGASLANALGVLCHGRGFNSANKWYRKRSERGLLTKAEFKDVLLGKADAASYLHGARRRRQATYGEQGITCECCVNRCSYKELYEYCNSGNSGNDHMPRKK